MILTDKDQALSNALIEVFPNAAHLLCLWHVNMNVLGRAKVNLKDHDTCTEFMRLFSRICSSSSEAAYVEALAALRAGNDSTEWASTVRYVEAEWLVVHQKFVSAWTSRHCHLGNVATSRVEGAHHTLKAMLRSRKGDLTRVTEHMQALFRRQADEAVTERANQTIRAPSTITSQRVLAGATDTHPQPFTVRVLFKNLVYEISHWALGTIVDQLTLVERPVELPACSGYHRQVLGMPCAHELRTHVQERRPLELAGVIDQWHLQRPAPPLTRLAPSLPPAIGKVVLDPNMAHARGRPPATGHSTRRDPSHFEMGQQQERRCGVCRETGHNSRTCPQAARTASQQGAASQQSL